MAFRFRMLSHARLLAEESSAKAKSWLRPSANMRVDSGFDDALKLRLRASDWMEVQQCKGT